MEKELKILLSLEMAKKWYNSGDNELKTLALSVYSEKELENITFKEIFDSFQKTNYTEYVKKGNAYRNILMVADYFNNNWIKTDNEIGYYWYYNNYTNEWDLRHSVLTSHNIVYYKSEEIAIKAFKLIQAEYEVLIESKTLITI